jgi:uncharacterized protein YjbJ (UPF0337 family)
MNRTANTAEHPFVSSESFRQEWSHLRAQINHWWDKLTDVDVERVAGQKDQLVRLLQEKYGYARERAEQEVNHRLHEYGEGMGTSAQDFAAGLADTAGKVTAAVQDLAGTVAETVTSSSACLQDLPGEVVSLIRRHPLPALLVGVGVGFLLASSLRKS